MAIWRMRIACWIPKATNTHSLIAFPLQQWLHERVSILRNMYITWIVETKKIGYSTSDICVLTVRPEMTSSQYHNIKLSYRIFVFHDTAVGSPVALRIERTASVPVGQIGSSSRTISQQYLLRALGLDGLTRRARHHA
jgi:hypothetical protein